jgi:hypothetical protein
MPASKKEAEIQLNVIREKPLTEIPARHPAGRHQAMYVQNLVVMPEKPLTMQPVAM